MAREIFPDVQKGDKLGASHVNNLNQVARRISGMGGGSFTASSSGQTANQAPFMQRVVKITRVRFEPSDEDDESNDSSGESSNSSFSSSSSASTSSSVSSSTTISSDLRRYYDVQPMYYDFSDRTWKPNTDEGEFELDASAFEGVFEVDDVVEAWWDQQREAYISRPSIGGCDRQNAIIDITILGMPTNGTFLMNWTIDGTNEPLTFDWNSSAATFKTQLATHTKILLTDLTVTSGPLPNSTLRIEFVGALAHTDISIPTANWTNLGGGSGTGIVCALSQKGHS